VPAPILAGAEPFAASGGSTGVLVLHGYTGSPQSVRPLAESLASSGCSVVLPLLPGHGTSVEDLLSTRWADWSSAAESSYGELAGRCDRVFVAGLSMGGTLAIWLALRHAEIAGVIVVNPLLDPPAESFREMLRAMLDSGAASLPAIKSDIAKEKVAESAYEATPIEPMLSMFEAVDEIAARLGELSCPVLLLSSRNDHVVPSESGDLLVEKAAVPVERVWLERSFHVATLDYDAPVVEASAIEFVSALTASSGEHEHLISREEVRHVARLARLALDDGEVGRMAEQLSAILEHVDAVRRLDTADVPPTAHPLPVDNVLRPDLEVPCLDRSTVLDQAPATEDDRFRVPPIMGEAR
jgi:carboxylesterase